MPKGCRVQSGQSIRAEPQTRKEAVVAAPLDPGIGPIRPVWLPPSAITTLWIEPEHVHHVVVKANAKAAHTKDFIKVLPGDLRHHGGVAGKLAEGSPLVLE